MPTPAACSVRLEASNKKSAVQAADYGATATTGSSSPVAAVSGSDTGKLRNARQTENHASADHPPAWRERKGKIPHFFGPMRLQDLGESPDRFLAMTLLKKAGASPPFSPSNPPSPNDVFSFLLLFSSSQTRGYHVPALYRGRILRLSRAGMGFRSFASPVPPFHPPWTGEK